MGRARRSTPGAELTTADLDQARRRRLQATSATTTGRSASTRWPWPSRSSGPASPSPSASASLQAAADPGRLLRAGADTGWRRLAAGLATAVLMAIGFSGTAFNFILPHTNSATFGLLGLLRGVAGADPRAALGCRRRARRRRPDTARIPCRRRGRRVPGLSCWPPGGSRAAAASARGSLADRSAGNRHTADRPRLVRRAGRPLAPGDRKPLARQVHQRRRQDAVQLDAPEHLEPDRPRRSEAPSTAGLLAGLVASVLGWRRARGRREAPRPVAAGPRAALRRRPATGSRAPPGSTRGPARRDRAREPTPRAGHELAAGHGRRDRDRRGPSR